jgi:GT2 family glycosyltransferase
MTGPCVLSVVIPTHGRGTKLHDLLTRLAQQSLDPRAFEVVVVDDGTTPPIEVDTTQLPYRLELLRQPRRGPAAARNRGIERCSAPLVLILNDDAVPARDLLERHLAAHADAHQRGLGDVAVLGTFGFTEEARKSPFVRLLDETDLLFSYGGLRHDALHTWASFWTCNISVPRQALMAVGGFDAQLFDQAICEDVELGYRLEQRGVHVLYRQDCVAHHDHAFTPREYFDRHARLGFFSTRNWAKHQVPLMLWAADDEAVQERFAKAVDTIELLGDQPEQLIAALERFEVEYRDRELTQEVKERLVSTIRPVSMSRWYRGIHLARHGVDAYKLRAEGPPAGIDVTIVVVSCNALENTRRCVASLRACADSRYPQRVIVVDNGSTDGSREWLAAQQDLELLENPANHGAPRARNQALRHAQQRGLGQWVAFLDNDVTVTRGWLERALYHGAVDPGVGSVPLCANRASKHQVVPYAGGSSQHELDTFAAAHHAKEPRRGKDSLLFTSLAVLVRREVIERIGGFDEAFSPWGFEDDDLSLRITLAGWRNRVARDTFVHHAHYATQEKALRHNVWMEENWRRFVAKWCGDVEAPRLFDFAKLKLPAAGQATEAQLVFALPALDAAPPRWEGERHSAPALPAVTLAARVVTVTPTTPQRTTGVQPSPARDWWSAPEDVIQRVSTEAADGRANVVVLGSGRSGTSMVTGMLAEAGWFAGDEPYPGRPANPKGFFETLEINGINEYLLSTAVRSEAPLGPMQHWLVAPDGPLALEVEAGLFARMKRLGRRGPFAYKDPRFSHTLSAWRDALPGAKFICIFRDPAATAASIVKECEAEQYLQGVGMTFERAVQVWKSAYRRVVDEHRHDGQWLFLHFDQLFTAEGVKRLEDFVGGKVASDFPERPLSRSRGDRAVDAESAALYATLCDLAQHRAAPIVAEPARPVVTSVAAPELSVVVCTYNRLATLRRCIDSFERQSASGRYELVVVDDGSTDGTAAWLDAWCPVTPATVVHRANGGLAAARNTGLERARGKYVLFVNDDTLAFEDLVERHLAAHATAGPNTAVLGTFEQPRAGLDNALMRAVDATHLVFCYSSMVTGQRYDWTRFWTCNVSVSREAVVRVGGFDESFQHYGCEDTDLAFRLERALGTRVLYDATARAHHEHVLSFEDLRRRARAVGGAWTQLFKKHPTALLHEHWRARARNTVEGHEALLIKTLPQRGRAEAFARELSRVDVGALERTGPEGEALALALVLQLREYLLGLQPLWWAEGERDTLRRFGVSSMKELVAEARARESTAA